MEIVPKENFLGTIFVRRDGLEVELLMAAYYGGMVQELSGEMTVPSDGEQLPKELIIYRSLSDGNCYFRPRHDFHLNDQPIARKDKVPVFFPKKE